MMKNLFVAAFGSMSLLLSFASTTVSGQIARGAEDLIDQPLAFDPRPFDFADKYYEENGIYHHLMIDRRDGADGLSVADYTSDPRFRGVRILATMPGYSAEGKLIYWHPYGAFNREAFIDAAPGWHAAELAARYPIYVFPSTQTRGSDRQAALIETDDAYDEKNVLGLALVIVVEFTSEIFTPHGQQMMEALAAENGKSLDGTPILKRTKEVQELTRLGYVTQKIRSSGRTKGSPYVAARISTEPTGGALTPDSFLVYVMQPDGQPLPGEAMFVENFGCLQTTGKMCGR